MPAPELWALRATEDFQQPGWLYIPRDMADAERQQWIEAALDEVGALVGVERSDGTTTTERHLRELLELALADEPSMEALATFQVWPLPGPAALTCRVCVVPSDKVPNWREVEGGAVHSVEAAHIGPGVQFSTRTTVEDEEGGAVDLYSVDLVFDDGEAAVVVSLEQSVAAMIASAFPGLAILKDILSVERPDGSPFASEPATAILDEQPWELASS